MKSFMKKSILTIIIVFSTIWLYAQPLPPSGGHGQQGNQPGGGAPIDGGFSIILVMGAIYGAGKFFKKKEE